MGKFSIPKPGVERAFYSHDLEITVIAQPTVTNADIVLAMRFVSSKGSAQRCVKLFYELQLRFIGKPVYEFDNHIFNPEL